MNDVNKKARVFFDQLANVYREEESRTEQPEKLQIEVGDRFNDDLTAILLAFCALYKQLMGDDIDLVGFTHLLNRLAIQHCFLSEGAE